MGSVGAKTNDAQVIAAVNSLLRKGCNRIVLALDGPGHAAREHEFRRVMLRCFPRHFLGAMPLLLAYQLADDPDVGRRAWTALTDRLLLVAQPTLVA